MDKGDWKHPPPPLEKNEIRGNHDVSKNTYLTINQTKILKQTSKKKIKEMLKGLKLSRVNNESTTIRSRKVIRGERELKQSY